MNTRKAANGILAVFFTGMLLLALFAEDLYRLTLPKVAVEQAVRKPFLSEVIGPDGNTYKTKRIGLAIPKEVLKNDTVYVLSETEAGFFLTETTVKTGEEAEGWVEVTEGLFGRAEVVIGSDREISEGKQVLKTEWNESVELHTAREQGRDIGKQTADMRKCLRNNVFCMTGVVSVTIALLVLCKKICKNRIQWVKVPVLILWCVLVCVFLRENIVIPGEWIPEKLINLNGWRANMEQYPF